MENPVTCIFYFFAEHNVFKVFFSGLHVYISSKAQMSNRDTYRQLV